MPLFVLLFLSLPSPGFSQEQPEESLPPEAFSLPSLEFMEGTLANRTAMEFHEGPVRSLFLSNARDELAEVIERGSWRKRPSAAPQHCGYRLTARTTDEIDAVAERERSISDQTFQEFMEADRRDLQKKLFGEHPKGFELVEWTLGGASKLRLFQISDQERALKFAVEDALFKAESKLYELEKAEEVLRGTPADLRWYLSDALEARYVLVIAYAAIGDASSVREQARFIKDLASKYWFFERPAKNFENSWLDEVIENPEFLIETLPIAIEWNRYLQTLDRERWSFRKFCASEGITGQLISDVFREEKREER